MMPQSSSDFPIPKMWLPGAQPWHGARLGAGEAQPHSLPGPTAACKAQHPQSPCCKPNTALQSQNLGASSLGPAQNSPQEPCTHGCLAGRSHHPASKAPEGSQRGVERTHCLAFPSSFPFHFLFLPRFCPPCPNPQRAKGPSQHGAALPELLPSGMGAGRGGNAVPPLWLPTGSIQEAAGTLAGLCRRHG